MQVRGEVDAEDENCRYSGHDHPLADRVERSVERGQRARVGLRDDAEQDRVGKGCAERDYDREDVERENDFIELDGEHGRSLTARAEDQNVGAYLPKTSCIAPQTSPKEQRSFKACRIAGSRFSDPRATPRSSSRRCSTRAPSRLALN